MPPPALSLRREPVACRYVSLPFGVRTISMCGAPAASLPSFSCGSLFPVSPGACRGAVLSGTFTGVSSAASTSSAASAAIIASSNPAALSCALTLAAALPAQPAETFVPSSMAMTCEARSAGTFP
jgi:hypothetical protein